MNTNSKTWIRSIPVELLVLEMTFLDQQIITGDVSGRVIIYNTDLVVKTQYGTPTTVDRPLSIAANDQFIAYGNTEGVVRFYTRQGLAREMVS